MSYWTRSFSPVLPILALIFALIFSLSTLLGASFAAAAKDEQSTPESNAQPQSELTLYALADCFFDDILAISPSWATSLGLHEHDAELEDFSAKARAGETALLKRYLQQFEAIDATGYSITAKDDLQLLKNEIRGQLLEIETIQNWRRDPDLYSSALAETLFPLIKRDFAPLNERLRCIVRRETKMPIALVEARNNIDRRLVPRVFAEVAEQQLPGIIDFFEKDVPESIKPATNQALKAEFARSNRHVIDSLKSYQRFVHELLADKDACQGKYALGDKIFAKKLAYEEAVDEPLDSLLAKGENELRRLQLEFAKTAKEIDASVSAAVLCESITKDHPAADQLLPQTRNVLQSIRQFCIEKHIVAIPQFGNVIVEETPPFMRALVLAAMDTAGPFDRRANESFYFVTLPEKNWSREQIEEHLQSFSYPDLRNTSVHECYPGHYVQFLWQRALTSKVRKILSCGSNSEGWAHYCEQMMIDEGMGNGDKRLRLVQLHDALLRACRYVVAIRMHTKGMAVAEATQFFRREAYMAQANAEREAKRGTMDPTYLVYTLGKLQILALRDKIQATEGDHFSLYNFHNRFLSVGPVPIHMAEAEILDKPKTNR